MKYHNGNANKMVGEDHLPDAGKMVGDTPRTDDESFFMHHSKYDYCKAGLARQLERELNEANYRIKRLEEAGDAMADLLEGKAVKWNKAKKAKL